MENMDVRWKQRLQNFKRAFIQLEKAVKTPDLNELERQGLIKAFEFTYELAWTTLNLKYALENLLRAQNTSKSVVSLHFSISP